MTDHGPDGHPPISEEDLSTLEREIPRPADEEADAEMMIE